MSNFQFHGVRITNIIFINNTMVWDNWLEKLESEWSENNKLSIWKTNPNTLQEWKCIDGFCKCHCWKEVLAYRLNGEKCPFCTAKSACIHQNVGRCYPNLASEWWYNNPNIYNCHPKSSLVYKWLCCKKPYYCHLWESTVQEKIQGIVTCPICNPKKNKKVVKTITWRK